MKKLYAMFLVMVATPFMAIAQEVVEVVTVPVDTVTLSGVNLWLTIAGLVIGCASSIAAVLPKPAEGSKWTFFRKILDLLAANIGNAKNAK